MSVSFVATIWCESSEGCIAWISPGDETATAARRVARAVGWARENGQDLCAGHKRKPEPCHWQDGARLVNLWEPHGSEHGQGGDCSYCRKAVSVRPSVPLKNVVPPQ